MATTTSPDQHSPAMPGRPWIPVATLVAFCLLLAATVYAVVRYGSSPREPRPGAYEIIATDPPAANGGAPAALYEYGGEAPVVTDEPSTRQALPEPEPGLLPRLGGSFTAPAIPWPAAAPEPPAATGPVDAGAPDAAERVAEPADAGSPDAALPAVPDVSDGGAAGAAGEAELRVPCGATECEPGKVCCNASCGTCTNPGERCSQLVCGMPVVPGSASCGPNTCNVGQICCNPSCGTCVNPGETCDQARCDNEIQVLESQPCGMQTCNVGFACCNPSCGICTRPGEPCSQEPCT